MEVAFEQAVEDLGCPEAATTAAREAFAQDVAAKAAQATGSFHRNELWPFQVISI